MLKAVPILLLALILVANVQGQSGPDEDDQDEIVNGISYFRIFVFSYNRKSKLYFRQVMALYLKPFLNGVIAIG